MGVNWRRRAWDSGCNRILLKRTCPTLKVQICQFSLVPIIPGPMELHRGNIPFPFSLSLPLLYFCLTIKTPLLQLFILWTTSLKAPWGEETAHCNMGLISDGDPNELRDVPKLIILEGFVNTKWMRYCQNLLLKLIDCLIGLTPKYLSLLFS